MFQTITIIGLGLIGGSLCKAVRRVFPNTTLIGVDNSNIEEAREHLGLEHVFASHDVKAACSAADLVVLATPVQAALGLMEEVAQATKSGTIISDVCSLKREIMQKAELLFTGENGIFIGGHPMAGAETAGFQSSTPFLFENAIHVLTPTRACSEKEIVRVGDFFIALGAHCVKLDAISHDHIAATVSHLPQLLAVSLMLHVSKKHEENPLYMKMAAGGFRDMTRIASSPFTIWRDICAGNKEIIAAEIDAFIEGLQDTKKSLLQDNLQVDFEKSAKNRLSIPKDTRGFLKPHFDLAIEVEDKPGVIARLANILAEQDINIKSIEILKVRENEGGTIRMAFEELSELTSAKKLLEQTGHRCWDKNHHLPANKSTK